MGFEDPRIGFEENHDGRRAKVLIMISEGGFISAHFPDEAQPDETNAQERARIVERAKSIFAAASAPLDEPQEPQKPHSPRTRRRSR